MGLFDDIGDSFQDLFDDLFKTDTFDDITGVALALTVPQAGLAVAEGIETERAGREVKRDAAFQADILLESSEEQAELLRRRALRAASAQRARLGAAGVTGSSLLVVQETLLFAFDEIARVRQGARLEAGRVRRSGRRTAQAAKRSAVLQVGSSLLGPVAKLAGA